MFTGILYLLALTGLIISFIKDKGKTKQVFLTALRSFINMLPQVITMFPIIAFLLAILDPPQISRLLGGESGVLGMGIGAIVGSITLAPPFVSLPLAVSLLKSGAGYSQITAFLTTLTMVGVATLPVEIRYLGKKTALKRNSFAFVYAIILSAIMGMIMS